MRYIRTGGEFKMRPKKYYLEVFETHYYFCLGWKLPQFKKWFLNHFGKEISMQGHDEICEGMTESVETDASIVVWTRDHDEDTLLHECIHAANLTLDLIGHKSDFSNDEVPTYMAAFIFKKAKQLRRKK